MSLPKTTTTTTGEDNGLAAVKVDTSNTNANPVFDASNFSIQKIDGKSVLINNKTGAATFAPAETSALTNGLQTGAQVVGALASGMNAYTGWKSLGLAEDTFDFTVAATNKDIANQAKIINNEITNANEVGLALGSGAMTADQIAASKAAVSGRLVDGSAIQA